MGRETWNTIKQSKSFYVRTYRMTGTLIIVSLLLNLLMGLIIYYLYFHQPARDFYATSGIIPPIKLKALDEPNNSPTALLPPDPVNDESVKVIPQ